MDWIGAIVNVLTAIGTIWAVVSSVKKGGKTAEEKAVSTENRFTKIESKVENLEKDQNEVYSDLKIFKEEIRKQFAEQALKIEEVQTNVLKIISKLER
jgi:hypothetical protein